MATTTIKVICVNSFGQVNEYEFDDILEAIVFAEEMKGKVKVY